MLNKKDRKLIYLDSAATALKPKQVISSVVSFYEEYCANIHRGIYQESEKSTQSYENVRSKVGKLINAAPEEVIFTKNTTEAINLVAKVWGEINIKRGDKILLSITEHHSNLIPWQELARKKKAKLIFIDINKASVLNLTSLDTLLAGVALVAITHVSNMLGTINPIEKIVKIAHQTGALVLIDGAQAVPHMKVDIKKIGCDFYTFSGHKMLAPSGVGVLWMKKSIAETLPPFLTGGGMINSVTLNKAIFLDPPQIYEAGTPNIEGVIGLGSAIDYLQNIGMDKIREHEKELTDYALTKLSKIKGLTIYGSKDTNLRGGIISFNIKTLHPHDIASLLDQEGIAVRAGHHCAQPIHRSLKINSSVRISFYLYNSKSDIDKLIKVLNKVTQLS